MQEHFFHKVIRRHHKYVLWISDLEDTIMELMQELFFQNMRRCHRRFSAYQLIQKYFFHTVRRRHHE